MEHVYPANAIAFHPLQGTFASGGSDGVVNVWDGRNQKKLAKLADYPTSVSALSFNSNGSLLAVASSYVYEEGEEKMHEKPDQLFVRPIRDKEVQPKSRSGK